MNRLVQHQSQADGFFRALRRVNFSIELTRDSITRAFSEIVSGPHGRNHYILLGCAPQNCGERLWFPWLSP